MRRLFSVVLVVIGFMLASCGEGPMGVADAISIAVQSEAIPLSSRDGVLSGPVDYEIRNDGDETMFLPHCEGAFAVGLQAGDGATWTPAWGRVTAACWTNPPIAIEPGDVYLDRIDVTLEGRETGELGAYRVVLPNWLLGLDPEREGPPLYSNPFTFNVR